MTVQNEREPTIPIGRSRLGFFTSSDAQATVSNPMKLKNTTEAPAWATMTAVLVYPDLTMNSIPTHCILQVKDHTFGIHRLGINSAMTDRPRLSIVQMAVNVHQKPRSG